MKLLMASLMLAVFTVIAVGETIVRDTFSDGDRTDGADAQDIAWYLTSGGEAAVGDDSAGIGNGNALLFTTSSSATQRRLAGNFSEVHLAEDGDCISLSFDFRITGTGDAERGFRFGLFDSNGTLMAADATSSTSSSLAADDAGYFVALSAGAKSEGRLYEDRASGTSFMSGTDLSTHFDSDSFAGINDNLTHTALLTITRETQESNTTPGSFLDVMVMDFLLDGTRQMADIDGDRVSPRTIFNEIGFSSGSSATDFVVDNVQVDFVPEPTSMALLALGGILVHWRKK